MLNLFFYSFAFIKNYVRLDLAMAVMQVTIKILDLCYKLRLIGKLTKDIRNIAFKNVYICVHARTHTQNLYKLINVY